MKKILSKLIFLVILLLPVGVLAAGNITVSPTTLTIEEGKTKTFTITATNAIGDVTITSSNPSVAAVSTREWETGMIDEGQSKTGTITVTGLAAGTTTITLTIDAATFDGDDLSGQTRTVNVTVKKISTNNNLSNIFINGNPIGGFSSSILTYNIETELSSINITATAEDSGAKITGTGNKTINYGSNKVEIKVTSESGSVKTYTINITRKDNRDTDNFLNSLTVSKGTLSFNRNTLNYNVYVDSDVEEIIITGVPESEKATISGVGTKKLVLGNNRFEITVTAENGSKRTYVVTVNRKDDRDSNKYLKTLSIDKGEISFDKDKLIYNVTVANDIEKVTISATAESEKAKVTGTGEKTLKVGKNEFEIVVVAENESVKTYAIIVTRLDKDADKFIKSLTIEGIDLQFDPNILEYSILIEDQTSLKFNYELPEDVTATLEGNENLANGSIIILKLKKDNGTKEYKFTVKTKEDVPSTTQEGDDDSEKSGNNWIIYVIIGGILLLVAGIAFALLKKKKDDNGKNNNVPNIPVPDVSSLNGVNNTPPSQPNPNPQKPTNQGIDNTERFDL